MIYFIGGIILPSYVLHTMDEYMNDDWIDTQNKPQTSKKSIDYESPTSKHRIFSNIRDFPKKLVIALSLLSAAAACDKPDTTAPTVQLSPEASKGITITKPEVFRSSGDKVYLGSTLIATFNDESGIRSISLFKNGSPIASGTSIGESCSLGFNSTDNSENSNVSPTKTFNVKYENNEKPQYSFYESKIDEGIFTGDKISLKGKEIYVGDKKIFAWNSDDYTLSLRLGKGGTYQNITDNLPFTIENAGERNLEYTLTNKKNQKSDKWTTTIKVSEVDDNQAPEITPKYQGEPNILGGVMTKGENNKLLFGDVVIYEGKDDNTEICTPSLKLKGNDKDELIGKEITQAGTYTFKLTDAEQKSKSVDFVVKCNSINLANLDNLNMQVGEKIDNLLEGISIPKGIEIDKVEIEIDGQRTEIKKSENGQYEYKPNKPGTCHIYITEKGEFGNTYVQKSNPLTIKDIEHQEHESISITNLKAADIVPIIGQVNYGDKNVYNYIDHLRAAEVTKTIDMMWKYGTADTPKEEYQHQMDRLNVGMTFEYPLGYDNYEIIEGIMGGTETGHAYAERGILNDLIKHANFKILGYDKDKERYQQMLTYLQNHPNSINIFGNSSYKTTSDQPGPTSSTLFNGEQIKKLGKSKNFIIWAAGTNIWMNGGNLKTKIYNAKYKADEKGEYCLGSFADSNQNDDSDQNDNTDTHIYLTISTNKDGRIDQTNATGESTKYPVGFAENVLFSGRAFPIRDRQSGYIVGRSGKYPTSDPNYLNVALTSLCFQMFAKVKDVDELMQMIRSTALTDYITFNGETLPLQLINPGGFFREYCMTADIPYSIQPGQTIPLNKKRYKGLVFDIPGAEVKINGQWVAYEKSNESLIKSQNPMNLEWRLNGDLVAKYSKNGVVTGKIIAVDDERNGLNLEKDNITINLDRGVDRSMVDIPYGIHAGETIMLTNGSTKGLIYDIPGAQMFIKGKSWVTYNDKNKKLIESQDLKNAYWRLNGDLAKKTTRNTYIKGTVFAVNDKGNIIDQRKVYVNLESSIRNHNSYIAQGYTKNEGNYPKSEKGYAKNEGSYQRSEKGYTKNEGSYQRSEKGYTKDEGNYKKYA